MLQSVAIGKRTNLTCGSFIGSFQNKFSKSYFTLGDNFANLTYGSFASPKAYRYRESATRFFIFCCNQVYEPHLRFIYNPVSKPESLKLPRKRCSIFHLLQSVAIDKLHGYNLKPESQRLPRERCPIFQLLQSVAIDKRANLTCGSFLYNFKTKFPDLTCSPVPNPKVSEFTNLTCGSKRRTIFRLLQSVAIDKRANLTCGSVVGKFQIQFPDLTYSPISKPESLRLPRKRCSIFHLLQSVAIDKIFGPYL